MKPATGGKRMCTEYCISILELQIPAMFDTGVLPRLICAGAVQAQALDILHGICWQDSVERTPRAINSMACRESYYAGCARMEFSRSRMATTAGPDPSPMRLIACAMTAK